MKFPSPLLTLAVTAILALGASTARADEAWMTDYNAALKTAAEQDRPVLVEFTGSDWCPPCKMLKAETLSKPEFVSYASENLILVELDFPQGKEQAADLKKQNEELAQKYGVEGFPTLVLLDSKGKEVARNVGFLPGGPDALITWIKDAKVN